MKTANLLASVLLGLLAGCGGPPDDRPPLPPQGEGAPHPPEGPSGPRPASAPPITTQEELRKALAAVNPDFWGEVEVLRSGRDIDLVRINDRALRDIGPLAGLPLTKLDLRECGVSDLGPLRGMRLEGLALENTPVADLRPLRGMPLRVLHLNDTPVEDISPLEDSPLEMLYLYGTRVHDLRPLAKVTTLRQLWLNRCPVRDVGPLKGLPLESLTLEDTDVEDLAPLAHGGLQRLHVGGSKVTDLSVLGTLRLQRLVFTPSRIARGIDAARNMTSLREIGTTLDAAMPPAVFWELYDEGKLK